VLGNLPADQNLCSAKRAYLGVDNQRPTHKKHTLKTTNIATINNNQRFLSGKEKRERFSVLTELTGCVVTGRNW
jgi:hypothetical protein